MIGRMLARNLRHHRRLLVVLCLGLLFFELLIVWIMSRVDTGPGLMTMLEMFLPPEFKPLIESQFAMASFAGAVAFGFRHPFVLVILVALAVVVGTIPAGERENGYLELLLARPVPRARYLAAVVALLVIGVLALPAAVLAGAYVGLALVEVKGELPWFEYVPSAISLAALMLAVGGYTLLIATGCRRRGSAIAQASGFTLAFFILDALAVMWSPLRSVSWISPFRYCQPIDAAIMEGSQLFNYSVLLAIFVAGTAASLWRFNRQDL